MGVHLLCLALSGHLFLEGPFSFGKKSNRHPVTGKGSIILPLNGNLLGNIPPFLIKAKGLPMREKNRTRLISTDFKIQRGTSGE
jgi:hypothetical protein